MYYPNYPYYPYYPGSGHLPYYHHTPYVFPNYGGYNAFNSQISSINQSAVNFGIANGISQVANSNIIGGGPYTPGFGFGFGF